MSNRKLALKRKYTKRGFGLITFKDDYGEECSLQVSSSIEPHIWLGMDTPKMQNGNDLIKPPSCMILYSRMHLNQKQARQLADELMFFAENGHLRDKRLDKENGK